MDLHPHNAAAGHDREPGHRTPNLWLWMLVCALLITAAVLTWWSLADAPLWDGPVAPP